MRTVTPRYGGEEGSKRDTEDDGHVSDGGPDPSCDVCDEERREQERDEERKEESDEEESEWVSVHAAEGCRRL